METGFYKAPRKEGSTEESNPYWGYTCSLTLQEANSTTWNWNHIAPRKPLTIRLTTETKWTKANHNYKYIIFCITWKSWAGDVSRDTKTKGSM